MTARKTAAAKKAPAKKTAAKAPEKGTPMDPDAPEVTTPVAVVRQPRHCYAMDVLVEEVTALFPEVSVEYPGEPDKFNTDHEVLFHGYDRIDDFDLSSLTPVIEADERVGTVLHDEQEESVLVIFHENRRIQDGRDGFGLAEAREAVLNG